MVADGGRGLRAVVRINNVYVSSANHGLDLIEFLKGIPCAIDYTFDGYSFAEMCERLAEFGHADMPFDAATAMLTLVPFFSLCLKVERRPSRA